MRPLSIISLLLSTFLITSFFILLVPKQAYANHCVGGVAAGCANTGPWFTGECFSAVGGAAGFANCENGAAPGPPGSPAGYPNTGNGYCQWLQDQYSTNYPQWAGITTACVNACIEGVDIIPRKTGGTNGGLWCTDPAADSPTSFDANRVFCCTYTLPPPTPTPIPPTPTPIPPTPTPTPTIPPPPTPTPTITCTLSDTDGLSPIWNETCTDATGTYKDTCSGNTPMFEFCVSNFCTQTPQATCPVGTTCIVQANGQPTCVAGPTPTPTPHPN